MKLIPVVLNGGSGSRLWPISRASHPKPFIRLPDGETLLQKTYRRALGLNGVHAVLTVTNADFLFKCEDEWGRVAVEASAAPAHRYILEPIGRNTAAAIACAALEAGHAYGSDAVLLIMPSDQIIANQNAFCQAVGTACELANKGNIVTFGIAPSRPHTGFGYIHAHDSRVVEFVEKPDAATAQRYITDGNYLWNAGIFCATAQCFLQEFERHAAAILTASRVAWQAGTRQETGASTQLKLRLDEFTQIPSNSIDYAVMEHTTVSAVVRCDIGWSDVGSWEAVSELTEPDADGNRIVGEARTYSSKNTYIWSQDRVTASVGITDLVIVDTPDALLVAHKDHSQDVKHVFDSLKASDHETHRWHRTVQRPWGSYTILEERPGYKVKRIEVKPGAALSLQMHHHRSEHWIVAQGLAEVVNGDELLQLRANQSTYIPARAKHRLTNIGHEQLTLIEVQIGSYLGEDDIVRFDDRYGRT